MPERALCAAGCDGRPPGRSHGTCRSAGRLAVVLLLVTAACRLGSDAAAPDPATADMTALFLEDVWFSLGRASASYSDKILEMSGSDGRYQVRITVPNVDGPGLYDMRSGGAFGAQISLYGGGKDWSTIYGGSGQVRIDTLSSTRATGTFSAYVVNPAYSQDVVRLQAGTFKVVF